MVFFVSVAVGYQVIGWPSLIGNGIIFLSVPIFLGFGKLVADSRKLGADRASERIELLTEIVSSIKLIKMFDWQENVHFISP